MGEFRSVLNGSDGYLKLDQTSTVSMKNEPTQQICGGSNQIESTASGRVEQIGTVNSPFHAEARGPGALEELVLRALAREALPQLRLVHDVHLRHEDTVAT